MSNDWSQIINNFFSELLFWFFLIVLGFLGGKIKSIKKKFFTKIEIKNITVRNVPKVINGKIQPISVDDENHRCYIENEIMIENKSEETFIDELVIDEVELSDYFYEDIVFQNGFDNTKQTVDFIVFNNGNKDIEVEDIVFQIFYNNKVTDCKKEILSENIPRRFLNSGEIERVISQSLLEYNIKKNFLRTVSDYKQSVVLKLTAGRVSNIVSEIEIPYLSSSDQFIRNLGLVPPSVDKPLTPIIEMVAPYSKRQFKFTINHILPKNESLLKFNILVDKPCLIKYKINLKNKKGKVFACYEKNNIKIIFPRYYLSSPFKDELYHYLHESDIKSSNYEEVRLRKPSLIFSIDKVKKEYNLN
ncbi:hypothetical protein [Streptococcus suis]|uniref:hypothetical protein n=1 Tax=Streptococcus suis TaxID=1307 RepID=UPI0037950BBE